MINIYDGNNCMLRAMTTWQMKGQKPISLRQRLASAKPSDIWVWDGPAHNKRRQDIYPPYKAKRPPLAEDLFSQINLFKELLCHTPVTQITVRGWEADDVIATIVKQYSAPVTVHSNDQDYFQLLRQPNVTLNGPKKQAFDPRWTCLFKALCGDSSDFIAGIPGFGPKAWEKTEGHREAIVEAILKGSYLDLANTPGFGKAHLIWLQSNMETLQNMFLVTHMWDVPMDELNAGITVGTPNPTLIDSTLRKYFL